MLYKHILSGFSFRSKRALIDLCVRNGVFCFLNGRMGESYLGPSLHILWSQWSLGQCFFSWKRSFLCWNNSAEKQRILCFTQATVPSVSAALWGNEHSIQLLLPKPPVLTATLNSWPKNVSICLQTYFPPKSLFIRTGVTFWIITVSNIELQIGPDYCTSGWDSFHYIKRLADTRDVWYWLVPGWMDFRSVQPLVDAELSPVSIFFVFWVWGGPSEYQEQSNFSS